MNYVPKRIISLVPSQTELLHYLGLEDEVVGITKFCVHPKKWFKSKTRVGGTKKLDIGVIKSLKPDLIIANKEENTKADIETLRQDFRVWTSDIYTLEDNLKLIHEIGEMTATSLRAEKLIDETKSLFQSIKLKHEFDGLYLIWQNPFMAVGTQTYIHDMLKYAGIKNVIDNSNHDQRYPELSIEQIKQLQAEVILLSSEPFPFATEHQAQIQSLFPNSKIVLVDGEMFSWYGSRPLVAAEYFKSLHLQISKL